MQHQPWEQHRKGGGKFGGKSGGKVFDSGNFDKGGFGKNGGYGGYGGYNNYEYNNYGYQQYPMYRMDQCDAECGTEDFDAFLLCASNDDEPEVEQSLNRVAGESRLQFTINFRVWMSVSR